MSVATTNAQTGCADCVVKSLPNWFTHSTNQDRNERYSDFLATISDMSHQRSPSSLTIHQTPGFPNYLALLLLISGYKQPSQSSHVWKMSNKQIVSNWDNWMQHLLTNYISLSSGCQSMAWLLRTKKFNQSMLTSACTVLASDRRCNLSLLPPSTCSTTINQIVLAQHWSTLGQQWPGNNLPKLDKYISTKSGQVHFQQTPCEDSLQVTPLYCTTKTQYSMAGSFGTD